MLRATFYNLVIIETLRFDGAPDFAGGLETYNTPRDTSDLQVSNRGISEIDQKFVNANI